MSTMPAPNIEIPITGLLREYLEKDGRHDLVDAGTALVDPEELARLEKEFSEYKHLEPDQVKAAAAFSILARNKVSVVERAQLGQEGANGISRMALANEAQAREFRALKGAFEQLNQTLSNSVFSAHQRSVWVWRIAVLIALILLCMLNAKAQNGTSQIDVISVVDNNNNPVATFAAPFTIKCLSNLTCTRSGSVLSVQGQGGGGLPCTTTALSLQYNNSGAFGCVAQFTYSGSTVTGASGTLDLSGMTLVKQRVGAACTTSVNGDLCYDSTNNKWLIWQGAANRNLIASTNIGGAGQVAISNADGSATFADPIVSGPDAVSAAPTRNPVQVGCLFLTAPTTLTNNQVGEAQCDSGQRLLVDVAVAPTTTVTGTVNTTPPANASTNLTQVAGTSLGATAVTNFGTAPAATAVPGVNASLFSGTTGLTNTSSALDVNLKTSSITLPVSGTVTANAGTNLNTSALQLDATGQASLVVGGGTTAPSKVNMIGGKTNDGTAQYDIMPEGAGGRSVIVEGFTGGTAVPVSGTITTTPPANASTNLTQVAGTSLGATAVVNYGSAPAAVAVPAVNAFVTNTPAVTGSGNFTVVQPTGTNLHAVLDTTSTTAVTQATAANLNATVVQSSGANLHVNCDSGCGGGSASTDEAAFTQGTTGQTPIGGFYSSSVTNLLNNQTGAFLMTPARAMTVSLRSSSGLDQGILPNPLAVSVVGLSGTTPSQPAASPSTAQLTACQFAAPLTPLTIRQSLPFQCDQYGNLRVSIASIAVPDTPEQVTPNLVGVLTDRSGTVTTGGTSQQLAPANSNRKYLFIENPTTATEALYINFTSAASTAGNSSISISPGGSLTMTAATYVSQEAVTVTAATSAHGFTAKEQ
jgi:hypothetical protein